MLAEGINAYLQHAINNAAIWHKVTPQTASWHVQTWYVAPPRTTQAVVALQMRVTRGHVTPHVYVDDVELVQVGSAGTGGG